MISQFIFIYGKFIIFSRNIPFVTTIIYHTNIIIITISIFVIFNFILFPVLLLLLLLIFIFHNYFDQL